MSAKEPCWEQVDRRPFDDVRCCRLASRDLDWNERSGRSSARCALRESASSNVDESGNYNVTVLAEALRRKYGIVLDANPAVLNEAIRSAGHIEAFVFNLRAHWFAIR